MTLSLGTVIVLGPVGVEGATSAALAATVSSSAPMVTTAVAVDRGATPPGWVPVAYDDVQISVPARWVIAFGCPEAVGNVYLGGMPVMFCPEENTAPDIVVLRTDTSTPPAGVALRVINGITTSRLGPRGGSLLIASRHVSITATGPSAGRVLNTVTYSPRAVALARTTAPDLPKSWHRVSFGGLSAAVPRAWPVERRTDWPLSCASIALRLADTEVLLSAGVREVAPSCPALASGRLAIAPPVDGVVIDPGPDGPVADGATFGPCLHVHGLRACPATVDPSGVLVLSVHRPGRTHALAVEVGLAGSGATARAIVDSLRAA